MSPYIYAGCVLWVEPPQNKPPDTLQKIKGGEGGLLSPFCLSSPPLCPPSLHAATGQQDMKPSFLCFSLFSFHVGIDLSSTLAALLH